MLRLQNAIVLKFFRGNEIEVDRRTSVIGHRGHRLSIFTDKYMQLIIFVKKGVFGLTLLMYKIIHHTFIISNSVKLSICLFLFL